MQDELTPKRIVEFAVNTEEVGAKFYDRMAKKFSDKSEVASLFTRLAKDEEIHKRQFMKLLEQAPESEGDKGEYERDDYLRAMAISEFFSKKTGPFVDAEKIDDRVDALRHAFNFEKATLGYYQAMQDALTQSTVLDAIIEEEKKHIISLMKVMITEGEFRGMKDEWP
jgi:rubrerythrin